MRGHALQVRHASDCVIVMHMYTVNLLSFMLFVLVHAEPLQPEQLKNPTIATLQPLTNAHPVLGLFLSLLLMTGRGPETALHVTETMELLPQVRGACHVLSAAHHNTRAQLVGTQ